MRFSFNHAPWFDLGVDFARPAPASGLGILESSHSAFAHRSWRGPSASELTAQVAPVATLKPTTGFAVDGVGTDKAPAGLPVILLTGDAVANDFSTTSTLSVNGAHVTSTIDTLGDFDFFKVDLVAGQYYDVGQYMVIGGPSLVPLSDAYLEIYDKDHNLILNADGGGPNTQSGLDALASFQATYTGTYYINARGFDQDSTNGTTGDSVGDYEVFVRSPASYIPRYSPDSPLHSIDWGSQVDRTSRNPDGDNGPRDNGAPNTGVVHNAQFDIYGKNVVTYYLAKTGDIFIDENLTTPGSTDTMIAEGFQQWEKDAIRLALDMYEQVADLVYIEVETRQAADFKFVTYEGTPGIGASLLGRMSPPNEENEGQGEFNAGDVRWTEEGLQQGGFYFPTLLHEIGHGHGMAHPHDNGGRSSIMRGAGPSDDPVEGAIGGQLGDYELSQQVFTIMSYNDGWQSSPYGMPRSGGITGTEVDHFGWVGTLSPLDIAVIQDKYGVNEDWAKGNDVYTIKDDNAAGTFFAAIWDAGGIDKIRYIGTREATIDLRAASLEYEEGGGGWVSYASGIHGGFTIANGVTIENATGGYGNDTIIGNDVGNVIDGLEGNDAMMGGLGDDSYVVDSLFDTVTENAGEGADTILTDLNNYTLVSNVEKLILTGSSNLNATGTDGANTLTGNTGANVLSGRGGADILMGGDGADSLNGGAGKDTLLGGEGADRFVYSAVSDSGSAAAQRDVISGFTHTDRIDLTAIDANANLIGNQAFAWSQAGFTGKAGQLYARQVGDHWTVWADVDGDRNADFSIDITGAPNNGVLSSDFFL